MRLVIWWEVTCIIDILNSIIATHLYSLLKISDILATFGAFMDVLIAFEIFVNIISYLRNSTIHIKLVFMTALMVISRKVIVLDYKEVTPAYLYATAFVVAALSLAYWLVVIKNTDEKPQIK